MGSFCDHWEDEIMDHLFGSGTRNYTTPNIYIGLSTTLPTDAGGNITEPGGGFGYARVLHNAWHVAASGIATNDGAITFPACSGTDWGSIGYYFAADQAAGGNILFFGSLGAANTIEVGDTPSIADAALSVTLDGGDLSFSNDWENEILDHLLLTGAYSSPAHIYIGLSTANPTEDGSGIAEPGGGSYARQDTTNATWNASTGGVISNSANITFPVATASWGHITHFFGHSAASGAGTMFFYGELTTHKTIDIGDTASFASGTPGALTVTLG